MRDHPASFYMNYRVFGNVHLLHMTDCHAQLLPIYFRRTNANLGVGIKGKAPHHAGESC